MVLPIKGWVESWEVVGKVASKLSASAGLASFGALPENVNYAVKGALTIRLTESNNIPIASSKAANKEGETLVGAVKRICGSAVQVTATSPK